MTKKEYTSLPDSYPVCEHVDCPLASTCLHQIAYPTLMEQEEYLQLINPNRCSKNEACTYYRNNQPVRYARVSPIFKSVCSLTNTDSLCRYA